MTRFDYFILLADMRTGSNFLETNLNAMPGIACLGEAFNPAFVGYPKLDPLFGIDLVARAADPARLIAAIRSADGVCGFRFFSTHDPRALDICLADPRCAKVMLTRNPLDSYVSLKIAQATGQWKLTNATHTKTHQITFDPAEFTDQLQKTRDFQGLLMRRLQTSGQTAFFIGYDDLHDLDVLNGLGAFLGSAGRLESVVKTLKVQNPAPVAARVANPDVMRAALADLDPFNLDSTPNREPRKGPLLPGLVAAARAGLLYMPLRSGPDAAVTAWLTALDGAAPQTGLTQKALRVWLRDHQPHRRFAVLRHPVERAHVAFCDRILTQGHDGFGQVRNTLRRVHKLPIPDTCTDPDLVPGYDAAAHRAAFLAFLLFLQANLAGQTGIRVDPAWASQLTLLQGVAQFALPDIVLRENDLPAQLPDLAHAVGCTDAPPFAAAPHRHAHWLDAIYDAEIEATARAAYARDYESFGFGDWR